MNTQASADKKLAFYAPAVPDKYRETVAYAGEVALYSSPSIEHGYGTGVSLAGVIDGREVVGRLKRGLYDKTISFECPKTGVEIFNGDLSVSNSDDSMFLFLYDDKNHAEAKMFAAEGVPDIDPVLREWGNKLSALVELRNRFFGTNEGKARIAISRVLGH
jgi:hypothetical protein